jgi:transposase-like protein
MRGYRHWTPAEKRAAVEQMAVCAHGKIAKELGISKHLLTYGRDAITTSLSSPVWRGCQPFLRRMGAASWGRGRRGWSAGAVIPCPARRSRAAQ